MSHLPASVFVDLPEVGRLVTRTRPVRLGDVDARARLRLDATARYLQDIATDDATDAELDDAFGWVVRRTMIDVRNAAGLDEQLELSTFCAGTGRSWAERRTSIVGDRGASIEAVSLWIRIDQASGRPTALGDDFVAAYGETAGGRRVSSRLQLPDPPAGAHRRTWHVRRVDIDPLGHVNNAAQWAIVEENLPTDRSRRGVAEVEHRAPVDPPSGAPLDLVTSDDASGAAIVVVGSRQRRAHRCSLDAGAMTGTTGLICLQGGRELTPPCDDMDRTVLDRCDGTVVVLAGAARPGSDYAAASARTVAHYRRLGVDVEVVPDPRDDRAGALAALDDRVGLIVLPGGSPGGLLDVLTDHPPHGETIARRIIELRSGGTAISGASAGAMVLCEQTATPDRSGGLEPGLGLVPGVAIPHWSPGSERRWSLPDTLLWGLPECGGVLIDGASMIGVGQGSASIRIAGSWNAIDRRMPEPIPR